MMAKNDKARLILFIVDSSCDMADYGKMDLVNYAIGQYVEMLKSENSCRDIPLAVKAVKYGGDVSWHVPDSMPIDNFHWPYLAHDTMSGGGEPSRKAGKALSFAAGYLEKSRPPIAPVIILVAGGPPTDSFDDGLKKLLATDAGRKSERYVINVGIGLPLELLERFRSTGDFTSISIDMLDTSMRSHITKYGPPPAPEYGPPPMRD